MCTVLNNPIRYNLFLLSFIYLIPFLHSPLFSFVVYVSLSPPSSPFSPFSLFSLLFLLLSALSSLSLFEPPPETLTTPRISSRPKTSASASERERRDTNSQIEDKLHSTHSREEREFTKDTFECTSLSCPFHSALSFLCPLSSSLHCPVADLVRLSRLFCH